MSPPGRTGKGPGAYAPGACFRAAAPRLLQYGGLRQGALVRAFVKRDLLFQIKHVIIKCVLYPGTLSSKSPPRRASVRDGLFFAFGGDRRAACPLSSRRRPAPDAVIGIRAVESLRGGEQKIGEAEQDHEGGPQPGAAFAGSPDGLRQRKKGEEGGIDGKTLQNKMPGDEKLSQQQPEQRVQKEIRRPGRWVMLTLSSRLCAKDGPYSSRISLYAARCYRNP